jgi:hypothetical protein
MLGPAGDPGGRCCRLGSPYSKPGTAEDALPYPARRLGRAGRHKASIAVVYGLCNAAIPVRSERRLSFWLPVPRHGTLARGNCARHVAAEIAMVAADGLQKNNRKHESFEESARAGAVGVVPTAAPAVKFFEREAPGRTCRGSHSIPPGTSFSPKTRCNVADEGHGVCFLVFSNGTPALVKRAGGVVTCAVSVKVNG